MSEVVNRNVPRRLASDAVEVLDRARTHDVELPDVKPTAVDPIAVGTKASEGVSSYLTAAQDIEATVAETRKLADAIARDGTALAAELRRKGDMMEKMVANFATLAAGTQQRMADERKHIEEITGGGAQ